MRPAIRILDVREAVVPGIAVAYQVSRVILEEFLGDLGGAGIGVFIDKDGVIVEGRVEKPYVAFRLVFIKHPQCRLVRMQDPDARGQQSPGQEIIHRPDYLCGPHLVVAQRLPGDAQPVVEQVLGLPVERRPKDEFVCHHFRGE